MTTAKRKPKRRKHASGASPGLAERIERGMPRPVSISLAPDVLAVLDELAESHDETRSEMVRLLVLDVAHRMREHLSEQTQAAVASARVAPTTQKGPTPA